jgi:hypothetical protein
MAERRQIWKFPITSPDGTRIDMPQGARILTVQMQAGMPTLWAVVDPEAPRRARYFRVVGTGHTHEAGVFRDYLGTVQDGPFVWHVFEVQR